MQWLTGVDPVCEFSNNLLQTVNPGETILFTENPVKCNRGFVRHRDDTGTFLLSGWVPRSGCGCCANSAVYMCDFGANIAIPDGGTVEAISVALTLDGATIPASTMTITPAAVEQFWNISRAINVQVWRGCCESLAIRNTSTQPILVQNANIVLSRPDLAITR